MQMSDGDFASMMVRHHRHGIEMSKMEESAGSSAEVKALAATIRQGQERDLPDLTAHAKKHKPSDMAAMHETQMQKEQAASMAQLKSAKGTSLDHAFVEEMIKHHQSALDTIKQTQFKVPALKAPGDKMAQSQQAELQELKRHQRHCIRADRRRPAESFRKYLVAEGADDALKRHEAAGTLPKAPIVRRYAKYGKTAVEVGTGARAFQRVVGQPLEFVPLTDPAQARAGSDLRVRLLFNGTPLARARFHAGIAPERSEARRKDMDLSTGDGGTAVVALAAPGLWNVRTIHVVPAPKGADADWEVHWATFVFRTR